jgi:hypothetical protein
MSECCSRRQALLRLASLSGVAAVTGNAIAAAASAATTTAATTTTKAAVKPAAPAAKPHVSPTEPTAVALAYHEDVATVDAKQFPTFKQGQQCTTCLQATGAVADAWLACNLFPGKVVASKGWCKVYVKKP